MKNTAIYFFMLAVVTLFANFSIAGDATSVRSYPIPAHGNLELRFPADWRSGFGGPPGALPPTISIGPENRDIYIKVTVFWNIKNDPDFNDPELLKATVYQIGNSLLPNAEESAIELKEINGTGNRGYYYTVTDKNPKPGEWKYMTQGSVVVKDLQLAFTILSHAKSSDGIDAAILMFKEAAIR